jgi:hypothetical protein
MFDENVLKYLGVMLSLVLVGGAGYGMIILLHALQQKVTGGADQVRQELAEVSQRLEQLEASGDDNHAEDMDLRLAEVEERLEFAERLLSSEDNRAKLPEPTDEVSNEVTAQG